MKSLMTILPKKSGRSGGTVTTRHQGGRQKRFLREIDFRRDKLDVPGRVEEIEYDPNRNANIARILYEDGERRYILHPLGLNVGRKVLASSKPPIEEGNSLALSALPAG